MLRDPAKGGLLLNEVLPLKHRTGRSLARYRQYAAWFNALHWDCVTPGWGIATLIKTMKTPAAIVILAVLVTTNVAWHCAFASVNHTEDGSIEIDSNADVVDETINSEVFTVGAHELLLQLFEVTVLMIADGSNCNGKTKNC